MRGSPEGSKSDIKTGRQMMEGRLHSREKDRKTGDEWKGAESIERQLMEGR